MKRHVSIYFARRLLPLDPWGGGSKGQNSCFSEHGHDAYEIKGNVVSRNKLVHFLSLHTPSSPGAS